MTIASMEELSAAALHEGGFAHLLMSHPVSEATQTSISMFLSCQQRYFLRHVYGLKKRGLTKPKITGTLFHLGLETLLKEAKDRLIVSDDQITAVMIHITEVIEVAVDTLSAEAGMVSPWDADNIEYCRVQALAMVEAWARVQMSRFLSYKIVGVEETFRSHAAVGGPVSTLLNCGAGKIDGLVEQSGRLFVLEHKTRSRLDTLNTAALSMDLQANWYMDLAEYRLGRSIDGFLYNVVKKPQHRMSAKGLGSAELQRRMVNAMMESPEDYFALVDILSDAKDRERNYINMEKAWHAANNSGTYAATMNPTACDMYGGCDYRALCQNGADVTKPLTIAKNIELHAYDIAPLHTELQEISDDA